MAKRKNKRKVVAKETIIVKLKESLCTLNNRIPIDYAYLFGSYAKGNPKPYSDIDVAVISPSFGNNFIDETILLMEAFEETGLMVEPHVFSREEYQQATEGTFLYNEVIQKGILL